MDRRGWVVLCLIVWSTDARVRSLVDCRRFSSSSVRVRLLSLIPSLFFPHKTTSPLARRASTPMSLH